MAYSILFCLFFWVGVEVCYWWTWKTGKQSKLPFQLHSPICFLWIKPLLNEAKLLHQAEGSFFGCAFWGAVDDMFKAQDSDFFSFLVFSEQPNRGAPIVDDLCFPMFFSSCFLYQNCSFHCTSHYVFCAVCFQENEISHQLS